MPDDQRIDDIHDWALQLAEFVAVTRSKDPSTKVGAVILRPDNTVASIGYNGFPRRVRDTPERLADREFRLACTVHAELNAILNAREPLHGYTLYVWPCPSCASCTAAAIQAGIDTIYSDPATPAMLERWGKSFAYANEMMDDTESFYD